jgi:SAM-dependent methyltransferase
MLEIGCGIGRMTKYFAGRVRHVTGLDVSEEMIRQARENLHACPNVRLDVGTGIDLAEYPDASFDFVFSYIVFQHIPDANVTLTYIREAGRVLRPGGSFYFQVNTLPRMGTLRAALGRLKRTILGSTRSRLPGDMTNGPRDLDHPAWQGSRVILAQVEAAAAAGGMRVDRTEGEGTQYTWVLARRAER